MEEETDGPISVGNRGTEPDDPKSLDELADDELKDDELELELDEPESLDPPVAFAIGVPSPKRLSAIPLVIATPAKSSVLKA